ncbi:PREDICTED: probable galacturonosyltransferase 15 isoform X1 [Tarenaya hassleriana]|uniref:probable galacturonosyltransferase 15 isoform X1 n=1 Tax=Tarenaya hassleriana TaxID=28532 RepID=UPI00053C61A7|nr:PREDICTED: probable galacturonosyltransferase 15 isoform X1 [Tarenaya hassleriana]
MKFYISATGIKRVTISNPGAGVGKGGVAAPVRRFPSRTAMLVVLLLLAIVLPFLFVRIAFLVLESASGCDSPFGCMGWRLFRGGDTSLKVGEELTRALVEETDNDGNGRGNEGTLESFDDLVKEMTSKRRDIRAFASVTKKMLMEMERKVQSAKQHELIYWHLASHGIPKSLHCLTLRLTEEYSVNAMARSRLPPPEFVSRLTDPSLHHVVMLTDNILAASVVISSTIENAVNPEKFVFHIVTDKKTYTPMHAWFAINSVSSPVVEVKGLHQFDWPEEVNMRVKEMLEIHRLIWRRHYKNLKEDGFSSMEGNEQSLQALSPSCLSLLNHLRIYIPKLFPDLNKIVLLDDDVVVQRDISSLWEMGLNGKVVGAVVDSWCGDNCCPGRTYKDYFNFSHPLISSSFIPDHCAWLSGMNVFDLEAWRHTNITESYFMSLRISQSSGLQLWRPGALPPALLAFKDFVYPLDPSWHVAGLGSRSIETPKEVIESAAVLHFSNPAKPWLEISNTEVRSLWYRHVNSSDSFIRKCKILS